MFENLNTLREDPIDVIMEQFRQDQNTNKVDLGVGVYRDEDGKSPLMKAVHLAEQKLTDNAASKEYLTPAGNTEYCSLVESGLFGAEHSRTLVSVQTPGGGPALRAAADLIKRLSPGGRIWVSAPTWSHHLLVLSAAKLEVLRYPYYQVGEGDIQREAMYSKLESEARAGDVILLHACCHNPTGQDLIDEDWVEFVRICNKKGLIPFVDVAYQGFAEGFDQDVAGLRQLFAAVPEMIVASTSSKSFGIYRERAGMLTMVSDLGADAAGTLRKQLLEVTRGLYFMAADHGAALVVEILRNAKLKSLWRVELEAARNRMLTMRVSLARKLEQRLADRRYSYIAEQRGMFSIFPLDPEQISRLRQQYSVYLIPGGRINVAGLTSDNIDYVAESMACELPI
jgi:aspartate aminotransferase